MKDREFNYDGIKNSRARFNLARKRHLPSRQPNLLEQRLSKILGPSFKYAGKGGRLIEGKRPDFINEEARIIIECYGNYWHKDDTIRKTYDRINLFQRNGYRTIIIWEHEINDPIKLRRKLASI